MNLSDPETRDRLAGEYALGTLRGPALRQFERRLAEDRQLRELVTAWERRLGGLTESAEPAEPPPGTWEGIRSRLPGREPPARAAGLWNSLPFWRGLAVAALLLLAVVGALALRPASTPAAPDRMVVVRDPQSRPVWVVTAGREAGALRVRTLRNPGMGPKRVCPLWLQWRDGHASRMVGVLPEQPGTYSLSLPKHPGRSLADSRVVVSIEPSGRVPARPHGRVVFRGPWISL